ncbi:MAG: type II toxin-antitoxin system RelE/ParE family toxin [Proteobacteria bacterium]|nr:type II toxin-antitoxin system RelE/ParE family toxin [Pseudomonadota bacterium]
MNVRWSPTARRDFADIFTFIDQRNPPAALRVGKREVLAPKVDYDN